MYSLLLIIIYISFISLGLPDSMLGAAWPVIHSDIGVPVSFAGIITMIIAGGTVISSLLSDRITRRFGAGFVNAASILMTALALIGFSISHSFLMLCILAVPYGLGAGAVDAALNNYVALHYASRHMSWLHCFWGIGAAVSPYIMGYCLTGGYGWNSGYKTVGIIQLILSVFVFISLPIWKREPTTQADSSGKPLGLYGTLKLRGALPALITCFGYCAFEQTSMLWSSTYLVQYRGIDTATAARFASLFVAGITFGRFLSGFMADKLGDKILIRAGIIISAVGAFMIALPVSSSTAALSGLVIAGLGCAPIYPCILHSTPFNFGKENSQAIIGIQMASAYIGITFMPTIFGSIASFTGIWIFPFYLILFSILMLTASERLNRDTQNI